MVQYKATLNLDTIVQRFGRAARDTQLQGVAILIAEPHWFYEDLLRREKLRQSRAPKRKRQSRNTISTTSPAKRSRTQDESNPDFDRTAANMLSPSRRANRVSFAIEHEHSEALPIAQPLMITSRSLHAADEVSEESEDEPEEEESTLGQSKVGRSSEELQVAQVMVEDEEVMAMILKGVALRSKTTKSTSSRLPRVPDRGTCLFINAHNLATKQRCRRWHINQYYANHLARMYW